MNYEEAKVKFIQTWGGLGSSWGINKTMAQIHALLLIATEALTTEEVMEELNISRGNANMNLRALIDWGLVEKEYVPGERKEYFVADKDIWTLAKQIAKERKKRELEPVQKVLKQLATVEGEGKKLEEFKKVTNDIDEFAEQADSMLNLFANSKNNWLYKIIGKIS
ncbi:MAG: helix-turn-helix domain-containing protein [Cyclobacteriaceae bacterium]